MPDISRRRMLTVLGVGAAAVAAPATSLLDSRARAATIDATCTAGDTGEQEVGPFYVADGIVRSDISSGEDGVPLTVTITVNDSDSCSALAGAAVDIWHASATGIYSDEPSEDTTGDTFLRGIQITDSNGQVTFTSIYPGWYSGRTQHIHARIYTGGTVSGDSFDYSGATLIWTGQVFFDPAINTTVATVAPYTTNTVTRTTNAEDRVYTQQNGDEVLTSTTGSTTAGYAATISFTVSGSGSTSSPDSTSLSLTAAATSVTYGKAVTLTGRLMDAKTATGLTSETVTVTATTLSGKSVSATTKTNSSGVWSLRLTPTATAHYRASYAATSGHAAATSTARTVTVHRRVAISEVSSTASAAKAIQREGKVLPAGGSQHVTVHKIVDGKRHAVAHATTDSAGNWSARWHMGAGKHHVVATVPASEADAAGTSRTITVRRT